MTMPSPAGWYPDPSGKAMQRYFDGTEWTDHYAPATPQPAGVVTLGGANHVAHAIIALLTCGLWLPIWAIVAATEKKSTRAVDVYGNLIQKPAPPRNPDDPPPSATPEWVERLPTHPGYLIAGVALALVTLALLLAALIL